MGRQWALRNNPFGVRVIPRYSGGSGGVMTDSDDDLPDNVIPFGHVIPGVIAEELRRYYQALLSAPLPEDILALFRQYELKEDQAAIKTDKLPQENEPPKEKV
jgi:hypothetical protein